MKLGIMQAYFFPYIGYFQLIDSVDTFVLYEHVTFRKKSWITRNRILDKGKKEPVYITVPVVGQSSYKIIKEINIVDDKKWKKQILNLIYFNYKKAPFFEEMYPFLENLIYLKEETIHNYNSKILIALCRFFDIRTKIIYQNSDNIEKTLYETSATNNLEEKVNRIFEIAKTHDSKHIVNAIGGQALYDKKTFKKHGFTIDFINTKEYKYNQFGLAFQPHLSIIDVLMQLGKKDTQKLIKNYEIV
ncbi:hypothetical protein DUT90_09570 [Polaribacter sp. WD7]|uniref:WbqC family protein n=1 Tax=Polaribacter sp. WD7 TaxID=2269061 RepID=UPI000DF15F0B|nr:WbqC family protein [Polaribacter sp. WD7]RCS26017.1 hypothetical protein DUT90_09570 [Polaribacter sp. WD7]